MEAKDKIIELKKCYEMLDFIKRYQAKEEVKVKEEKQKVLVLTKRFNSKNLKVA